MNAAEFLLWFLDTVGLTLRDYLWHLLGCLILWIGLCLLPSVNRASAFVFAFSAWFLLLWAVDVASLALRLPHVVADPTAIALYALPIGLFGYCALSSLLALRAPRDVEFDAARFVRLGWFLLPAHLIHMIYIVLAENERAAPY